MPIGHGYGDATLADWQALELRAKSAEASLATANGLWRYWCSTDITENEDDWVAFSDAVHDHLQGKAVPERFRK